MALRIRYEDHEHRENWVISIQKFVSKRNGAKYRVLLDMENKTYNIRNERTKEFIYKSKSYGNLNVLKRNARNQLEKLGVELNKEVRDRTFGICPKGYTQDKHENN